MEYHTLFVITNTSQNILSFDRPPILLFGSGMTRRYTEHSPDWHELLYSIAERIGISRSRMVSFEEEAKTRCDKSLGHMPMLATILGEQFRRRVVDEGMEPSSILTESEMIEFLRGRADAIKIMAATEFSGLILKNDNPLRMN